MERKLELLNKEIDEVFSIENFNIFSDEENYYFFRSLEEVDIESINNKSILDENGEINKLITDREFYGETVFKKDDPLTLEQIVEHIKIKYNNHTNCISFSSNANVALDYGRNKFNDRYVMLKVPKNEFGKNIVNAGQYMLSEVNKVLCEYYKNLNKEDSNEALTKYYFDAIDNAKTQEQLDKIKSMVTKDYIDETKNIFINGIEKATTSLNYGALNREQNLLKNKIVLKMDLMNKPILKKIGNTFLLNTIGGAFSSLEIIHYNDVNSNNNLNEISPEIMDVLSIIQQAPENSEIKTLKTELISKLKEGNFKKNTNDSKLYNIDLFEKSFNVEEIYEITNGKVDYKQVKNFYKKYVLAKSRLRKEISVNLLKDIMNDPKYNETIESLRNDSYGIESVLIDRLSDKKSIKLSESVNLLVSKDEEYMLDYINNLSMNELEKLVETPMQELQKLVENNNDDKYTIEQWVANSIIDSIDWKYYGIRQNLSEGQRELIVEKLIKNNFFEIYKELKNKNLSDTQLSNMIFLSLIRNKEEVEINDRFTLDELEDFLECNKIKDTNLKLKKYQRVAYDNINKAYNEKQYTSVILPTGTGKSYVAISEMHFIEQEIRKLEKNRHAKILYLAPNSEILDQLKRIIIKNYRTDITSTDEEILNRAFPNLTMHTYMYLSIGNNAQKIINDNYDFIVFDELHRTGANEWEKQIDALLENQSAKVLGITATPERDEDKRDMSEIFAKKYGYTEDEILKGKHLSYKMNLLEAIKRGIVNNPKVINCEYSLIKDGSLEELKIKIEEITDENIKKEKMVKYEKLRKQVSEANGIEKILKENLKSDGKYIVFIPLSRKEDGTYFNTETEEEISETKAQSMIRSYQNLMHQFLFSGEYLEKNGSKLTYIYNKLNNNDELDKEEIDFLNQEKDNILLLTKLHIKNCPNALQILSNDIATKIIEYMSWEILPDSKISAILRDKLKDEVENYSMLSDIKDNINAKELSKFNSTKSKKKKFMFVMNKLNEGVHVKDIDGIIWFRPLSEKSKILFLQQLGRCISAVGDDNKDKVPLIIDLVNNTLKIDINKGIVKEKKDLEKIRLIEEWIKYNGMPKLNSKNKEEYENAKTLERIKKEYNKFLDEEILESQKEERKKFIIEILQIGSEFDLWNHEFEKNISIINKTNNVENIEEDEEDLLSIFEIRGISRELSDLYKELEGLSLEEKIKEYIIAMDNNDDQLIPQKSTLTFSDKKTKMSRFWESNRKKIYESVIVGEESEYYKKQYPGCVEEIITKYNEYNNKQENKITINQKIEEYIKTMCDNNDKLISETSFLLFSDNTKMNLFWQMNKERLYNSVTIGQKSEYYKKQYPGCVEEIITKYNEYNNKQENKITIEQKIEEYIKAMDDNDDNLIAYNSKLLFSDGVLMNFFWSNNREILYNSVTKGEKSEYYKKQYPGCVEEIITKYNEYNNKQENKITIEQKIEEYIKTMHDNNDSLLFTSNLIFSDNTKMNSFWGNNRDNLYNSVTIGPKSEYYKKQYPECVEKIITRYNKYNNKQENKIAIEQKIEEYIKAMHDNDDKLISKSSKLLFSDSTQMRGFWRNNREDLYNSVTEGEKSEYYQKEYPECVKEIVTKYKEYNNKQENKITIEQKIEEYIMAMHDNDDKLISKSSKLLFSDNTQIYEFWRGNKEKLYNSVTEGEKSEYYKKHYPECVEEIIIKYNEYNNKQENKITIEQKIEEYIKAMHDNDDSIILSTSNLLFSDNTKMNMFWSNNRDILYNSVTEGEKSEYYKKQYSECVKVIIDKFNKTNYKQENKITIEQKIKEYIMAMHDNNDSLISSTSKLLFSDSSKMRGFWDRAKKKLYMSVTEGEKSEYYQKNYPKCVKTIITKYTEYKNNKEKYNESKEKFDETSNFANVVKKEMENKNGKEL